MKYSEQYIFLRFHTMNFNITDSIYNKKNNIFSKSLKGEGDPPKKKLSPSESHFIHKFFFGFCGNVLSTYIVWIKTRELLADRR